MSKIALISSHCYMRIPHIVIICRQCDTYTKLLPCSHLC